MTLTVGTQLGSFEITGALGAGGMGEVYRATDTKLGRAVAIKTLPAVLAQDKDRLARFEREAQLLATLNHPHIAAVYGLDEHEGTLYIAMELVEGETLEQRLKKGALPVAEALQIALQIAGALEAAHDKGVVHRDLKPANVMLNTNGQVKVLDFGLAKAFSGAPDEASPLHSPALSVAMTQQGLVLGTAGYMSPEQASGQGTDQRGDVWAFGVVLYEMLTGLPLFRGETVPHILADVLKTEPDWERLPPNLHPRIRLMLERCLTKRPQSRLHSIADARIEIEAVLAAPEGVQPVPRAGDGTLARPVWPRLLGACLATAVIAAVAGWSLRPAPEPAAQQVVRFSMPVPEGQNFTGAPLPLLAVSRDGTRIAYVANNRIFLRNLQETEARPLAGTEGLDGVGATSPVFSPDGQWLAFVHVLSATGPYHILRVPVSGGAPVRVYTAGNNGFPMGLSWPEPETMIFTNPTVGVVAMPANGGDIEVLVPSSEAELLYSPQLLPGREAVLFTRAPREGTGFAQAEIVVQGIGADDRKTLIGGRSARYLPTGHLVYANGNSLFGIAFDPQSRSVRGGAVPLLNGLRGATPPISDTGNFVISDTGTLVRIPGTGQETTGEQILTTLSWVDRNGRAEPLPLRADDYTAVRISPDGTRAALTVGNQLARGAPSTLWIYDFDSTNLSLLTTDPPAHDGPVWSPDGQRLYFRSPGESSMEIFVIDLDTRAVSPVYQGSPEFGSYPLPWSISDAEDVLTIINAQSNTEVDFAMISLPDGEFIKGLDGEGGQNQPVIAPNGQWLAYAEAPPTSGEGEINLRPYPNLGRTLIPVGPGTVAVFSRDGTELLVGDGNTINAYPVTYEPTLRIGAPEQVLQSSEYMFNLFGRTWDPDPTAERFLMIRQPGTTDTGGAGAADLQKIEVVLNWDEELSQRVPVD